MIVATKQEKIVATIIPSSGRGRRSLNPDRFVFSVAQCILGFDASIGFPWFLATVCMSWMFVISCTQVSNVEEIINRKGLETRSTYSENVKAFKEDDYVILWFIVIMKQSPKEKSS